MKTKLFSILTSVICLTVISPVYSQDKEPKFKKVKTYTKTYSISSSDRISLDNQFGEMKLITWGNNEVKVDVSITGSSDEESRAQEIMDRISIQDEKNGSGVSFRTVIGNNKEKKEHKNKNTHEGMKINYTVYLPSGNPLTAKNQFGAMIVPDYSGEANLESQFGSLTTGKISNSKLVKVAFGSAAIGHINNGKVDIQYSTGTINKLSGDIDLKVQFCQALKINIDNDIKSLDIDNSYSTLYLDMNRNLSATYDISTSYGSFTNESNFKINKSGLFFLSLFICV